jgi:hypothetical protein
MGESAIFLCLRSRGHLPLPCGVEVSAPPKIQFYLSDRFFRAFEKKCSKTLHWTPMGTRGSNLATAIPVLDDTANDLVPLHPLHPPDAGVNVVRTELNSSHKTLAKRTFKRALLRKGRARRKGSR